MGATTLNIMTHSIKGKFVKLSIHDSLRKWHSITTLYHFIEGNYAECLVLICRYAECCYAECRYAECHYAECRGAF
jgi:hypothetical protein